jgi:hypothetical protein
LAFAPWELLGNWDLRSCGVVELTGEEAEGGFAAFLPSP